MKTGVNGRRAGAGIVVFGLTAKSVRGSILYSAASTTPLPHAQTQPGLSGAKGVSRPALAGKTQGGSIWESSLDEGFRPETKTVSLSAEATYGIAAFGSREDFDPAVVGLAYNGHMPSHVFVKGHWHREKPELGVELFTGAQISPRSEWLVELTPHLERMNRALWSNVPLLRGIYD